MNIKKIISLLALFVILIVSVLPINATDITERDGNIIYFEDGSYLEISEVRIVDTNMSRAAQTITGAKDMTYTNEDGEVEWKYTLTASFTYDPGVSSTCTSATYSNTIYDNNWSFSNGYASRGGNAAHGSGLYIKKVLLIKVKEVEVSINITCDTYGNLS